VEADEAWLAEHRSDTFARLRRRMPLRLGEAVSNSVLNGTIFSTPRNPRLKLYGHRTEQIRYAESQYAYTAIAMDLGRCRVCGQALLTTHRIVLVGGDGRRTRVGQVTRCRRCHSGSWMFQSRMPSVLAARRRDQKVVL
jgi:hypothetical protein